VVEHTTHNRAVAGSIPATATTAQLSQLSGRLLVALSGGPDSTALLLMLQERGADVVAAHFDHGLRPASAAEAAHVAAFCAQRGIQFVTERRTRDLPRGSPMAAARELRYDFLERARAAAGAATIVTAHTEDDLVENVLIHLLRGTGLRGLRGMPPARPDRRLVRPLLGLSRAEIEEYLRRRGLTGAVLRDPSNHDPRYLRARVRSRLLPALEARHPGIRARLLAIARAATAAQGAPPEVEAATFRRLYAEAGGPDPGLTRRHLAALARLATGRTGAAVDLPGGIVARRLPEGIELAGAQQRVPVYELSERRCPGCSAPEAVHLRAEGALTVARRAPGMRIRHRKLQDVLVDAKVPRHRRDQLPIVLLDGRPVWVPGVVLDRAFARPQDKPGRHVEIRTIEGEGAEGADGKIGAPTSRSPAC
jgi:tRNA(Ile)-lysidine synthase